MKLNSVYVVGYGSFLPGEPVSNEHIDEYIRPIDLKSSRIKNRILRENGIETRHYGIDKDGQTRFSLTQMAAESSRRALEKCGLTPRDLSMICTGTTGGDQAIPGFANMLQAEMKAPPLETSSHTGICMSGVVALKHAAHSVELGQTRRALVSATDFPSRMFKNTRFQNESYNVDFDSHFLRWMLSDGAGSWILSNEPLPQGLSLKVSWIHTRSFSGDFPLCMQIGSPKDDDKTSYLDYPSLAEAEKAGAFLLRQNIRLLPHLFDVGIGEYVRLINEGHFKVEEVDHFLCHYSSEKFAPVVAELMEKAGLRIPSEKWFSNLKTKGNTGSASIFIMLDDFMRTKQPKAGEKILCFIPESGRFSVSFIMMEVVEGAAVAAADELCELPASPSESLTSNDRIVMQILRDLADVWHDYRSQAWRTPVVNKIVQGNFTNDDYVSWMESWVPQVRQGSKWMREAISNLSDTYADLRELIETHASEEQNDWKVLFNDYRQSGGTIENADELNRNRGGEALNAFMFHRAMQRDAIDLLGAIYIIEGTGQKIIPALFNEMKRQTGLPPECFRFLQYHGENDENHLLRWLGALEYAVTSSPNPQQTAKDIVNTARTTSKLYLMQLEEI